MGERQREKETGVIFSYSTVYASICRNTVQTAAECVSCHW